MRANISEGTILSIGMIVKNEAKNLERCLRSLQALRDAVPSELIIADTGSEDGTMEIAREYADLVFRFTWCDDFAAARNATLDRAEGEWFLFIDADEWFENTDELIRFLSSNKRKRYHTATYIQRNYKDMDGKEFSDFFATRMCRRAPDRRFKGAVHETLGIVDPTMHLHDFVHHYGYVGTNKGERNIPLMLKRMEEEGGQNPQSYLQLSHEYSIQHKADRSVETARTGLALMEEQKLHATTFYGLYHEIIRNEIFLKNFSQAAKDVKRYFETRDMECATDIDISYLGQVVYMNLQKYEESLECYERYKRVCGLLDEGKLDETDRITVIVSYYFPENRQVAHRSALQALYHLNRFEDALQLLDKLFLQQDCRESGPFYGLEGACIKKLECWERYAARYKALYAAGEEKPLELLCEAIDSLMFTEQKCYTAVADMFNADAGCIGPYADLLRLRRHKGLNKPELLARMLKEAPPEERYGELVYFAMRCGMDFVPFIQRVDMDNLGSFFKRMARNGDLGEQTAAYYLSAPQPQRLVALRWETVLLEKVLLESDPQSADAMKLFDRYCQGVGVYVHNVYNPELLTDPDRIVLPRVYRFGLLAEEAYALEATGDKPGFLKKMKEAGEVYPVMFPFIRQQAENTKKQMEQETRLREEERRMLLENIKETIYRLIDAGDQENARKAIEQYARVAPSLQETEALYSLLQSAGQLS